MTTEVAWGWPEVWSLDPADLLWWAALICVLAGAALATRAGQTGQLKKGQAAGMILALLIAAIMLASMGAPPHTHPPEVAPVPPVLPQPPDTGGAGR